MTRCRGEDWYLIAGENNIWGWDHDGPHHVFLRVCKVYYTFDDATITYWGWYYYGLGGEDEYIVHGLFDSRPDAQAAAELYFHIHVEGRDE